MTERTGHDPLKSGISRRYVDSMGLINGPGWTRAFERKEIVGSCRQPGCGGLLQPIATQQTERITWYGAECLNCGHQVVSPNGRTLPRSSRREEMPDGAWERRTNDLAKLAEIGKGEAA